MSAIVTQLNDLVNTLNGINPYWYVVLVGPLVNATQHLMQAEKNFEDSAFAKKHGLILSLLLAFGAGGFYAVIKDHSFQSDLIATGLVGSPIWVISQLLYQNVSSKIKDYRVQQLPATATPSAAPLVPENGAGAAAVDQANPVV
jgi:hypothetical protein